MRDLLKDIYDYPGSFIGLSIVSLLHLFLTYLLIESVIKMILNRRK